MAAGDRFTAGVAPWLAYPAVISVGIGLHLAMTAAGVDLQPSSYAAVAIGAGLVTLLEFWMPHLPDWRGRRDDVNADLLYMVGVQMVLPVVLALTLSVYLLRQLQGFGLEPAALWPHHWPIGLQVILMLLAADFLRYWLHVASHRYEPLWRLHAVHHSPPKLYWLNVARFHPVEKALQYLFDALPFVLVGVSVEVLALYFVFYGLNGFFQHSNIELRFGFLNYVISSAELHRWHHSRLSGESNANYGNNLIIWDVLFGTRFLPGDRQVGEVGLPNTSYPLTFTDQLKTPFIKGIEAGDSALLGWSEIAMNVLLRARMLLLGAVPWQKLVRAARNPARAQRDLLKRILAVNGATQFAIDHGFSKIHSYEDYRSRVPVQSYESLRPYIDEQERTGQPLLNAEPPIMYAQTSGTTGEPKLIPILQSSLDAHKQSQNIYSYVQFRAVPEAYYGRLLGIVSPAVEGHLETGTPFGSASGHVYKNMPRIAKVKYVIPYEAFDLQDYDLKYLLILRLAIAQKNITSMASANPSTFLKLSTMLRERRQELLHDAESQTFGRLEDLPPAVREAIRPRLKCPAGRLVELRSILGGESPSIQQLWPYLRLLTTWTGGSCGIALESVRELLPPDTRVAELGYLSSEFRGSITIDLESNLGVPTLMENFFEFVEKDRWEDDEPEFLTLDELETGREYYVIVTTNSGLYRYYMNDIVRVTGRFFETPTIEFVQKGKGVTNITGEKLYESQVIQAVKRAEEHLSFSSNFFTMIADPGEARYRLLIEPSESGIPGSAELAATMEEYLGDINIEYAQKRHSGRLCPLVVHILRGGSGEAYKALCVDRGQREGQFKAMALQYLEDLHFPYDQYTR